MNHCSNVCFLRQSNTSHYDSLPVCHSVLHVSLQNRPTDRLQTSNSAYTGVRYICSCPLSTNWLLCPCGILWRLSRTTDPTDIATVYGHANIMGIYRWHKGFYIMIMIFIYLAPVIHKILIFGSFCIFAHKKCSRPAFLTNNFQTP